MNEDKKLFEKYYKEFINNTCDLFKEMGLLNPSEIFAVFYDLLRCGCFSYNGEFYYSNKCEEKSPLGASVFTGRAVCRHISSMLNDIYKGMGYESYELLVVASKEALHNAERLTKRLNMDIDKTKTNIIGDTLFKLGASNHQINMVSYLGETHIIDPTNNSLLDTFDDTKVVLSNNHNYGMEIGYNSSVVADAFKISEVKRVKELLNQKNAPLDSRLSYYNVGLFKIKFNEDLINKYIDNNGEIYKFAYNYLSKDRAR